MLESTGTAQRAHGLWHEVPSSPEESNPIYIDTSGTATLAWGKKSGNMKIGLAKICTFVRLFFFPHISEEN